ncbi:hypothetical protein ACQEVG_07770 [Streptomyces sp. CA-135486]|uniref:hypothetical protein n=1 Tax=Streptomyces sp. CA-135486 TaxID=3240049 RepID=UPI003D8E49E1
MEWLTLVGTLSGGVLGVGSTLLVEAARARRERGTRIEQVQRDAYLRFLTALTETETALLALSQPVSNADVVSTYRAHQILPTYYELLIAAPREVCDAARAAYRGLRAIRDAIATTGLAVGVSAEWHAVHDPYDAAVRRLRSVMRESVLGDL